MNLGNNKTILFLALFTLLLGAYYVLADETDPQGPDTFSIGDTERRIDNALQYHMAEAGNITELDIFGITQTETWQGYWGNVSGRITLDDAGNYTLYDWELAEPQGEVYAVNGTPTWANIRCFNYSEVDGRVNLSTVEGWYGLQDSSVDGVNETFNETIHPEFWVGTYNITVNSCPSTWMYQNDQKVSKDFIEVLLTDNNMIVFTAIIENRESYGDPLIANQTDKICFNNQLCDFQMIVGEDGHDGDDLATLYYFYIELE